MHGVNFAVPDGYLRIADHTDAGMEEEAPGASDHGLAEPTCKLSGLFPCQNSCPLQGNALGQDHEVSWPLALLADKPGFFHLSEHLARYHRTLQPLGNFRVTATKHNAQCPARPQHVLENLAHKSRGRPAFREQERREKPSWASTQGGDI